MTPHRPRDGRPTLLVFTLGAAAEAGRRRRLPGALAGAADELHRAGLGAALAAGRQAGCEVVVSSPRPLRLPPGVGYRPQRGAGFGERLEGAVAAVADGRGGEGRPLLVVGTDVPGLAAAHLAEALEALAENPDRVVLGPSPDGGFYLLASARPLPGLARMTRWCRPDTLAGLRRTLAAAGRPVVLLSPLADLDRAGDVERWLAAGRRRSVVTLLGEHVGEHTVWRELRSRLRRLFAALRRPLLPAAIGRPRPAWAPVRVARGPPRTAR